MTKTKIPVIIKRSILIIGIFILIIVDFSQIMIMSISAASGQFKGNLTEDMIRHIFLNNIAGYRKKYSAEFGDNFITVNNGKLLVTGNYISILGYSYRVVNVEGNKVYIDAPFVADQLSNTPVTFTATEFKTITLS